jgi:hypothetical protein
MRCVEVEIHVRIAWEVKGRLLGVSWPTIDDAGK